MTAISDAANGGTAGFYFLPPMVPDPGPFSGTFDATLSPVVRVCRWNGAACTSPDLVFNGSSGSEHVAANLANESYGATWLTANANLSTGNVHRLRVYRDAITSTELGFADIVVVSKQKDLKDPSLVPPGFIGLVNGKPYQIRFRIETSGGTDQPPTAVNDAVTVGKDAPATTFNVLANDTDPDGGPKSIASVSQPANGTVVITNAGADLTYQPNAGYCNDPPGTTLDTFTYTLAPGGSTTTVTVTVTCDDDAPVAVADAVTVVEDAPATAINVLANDTDPDGGPKSIATVTQPANGTVVITNAGADLTYQPNANYCNSLNASPADQFTYTLAPGGSGTTVTMTVTCVNDAPVGQTKAAAAHANLKIIGVTPGLLTGVADADAGISGCTPGFAVASITSNTGGTVSNVNLAAGSFDFDPAPGFTGTAVVNYTVSDNGCPGAATSATAAINITVSGPVIWFVDPAVTGPGDGRLSNPFKFLSGNPGVDNDADDVDAANHRIFLYSGTSGTGIALNQGEWLIGQGVTGASFDNVMGIAPPAGTIARPPIGGALPTIQGTVTVNTQSASSVVNVLGFNLSTGAATGLTNSGTTINGVTVNLGSVSTTTGNALAISGANNGATTVNSVTLASITVSGAAAAPISVANFTGALAVTGATSIQQRTGTGILLSGMSGSVSFAATTVANPTNAGGYGIRVENSSASVTFASATISNANVVTPQNDTDGDGIPNTDGDGDAIFLTNNTGTFTLSGGTLSNCGNDCIDLRNSTAVVLSNVTITTPGLDVTGATGAGFGGHNISAINLTGVSSITGTTVSGFDVPNRDGLYLINTTSTPLTLTIHGSTFQNGIGNRGIGVQGRNASQMNVTVGGPTNNAATNTTFSNILGTALQATAGASSASTATLNLTVQNSTFQNSPTNGKTNLIAGVAEAGRSNVIIRNNTFNNVFFTASTGEALINVNNDGTLAGNQLGLTIQGNIVSNVGSAANICAGGAVPCRGPINAVLVFIDDAGNVPGTITIEGNVLTNVQQGGLLLDLANTGAASSAVSAKIINNTFGTDAARVGVGTGATVQSGIRVERRRNNSFSGNVLISGNVVRNGNGGAGSTLNSPGIFARTKANANLSVTVTGNSVDTDLTGGVAEMRFDTNANDAGDIIAPTQCVDITGNSFPAGASAIIDLNEVNGTHNVEQASAAAVTAANGGSVMVTADAGVSFGVACATPPALMAAGGSPAVPRPTRPLDEVTLASMGAAAIDRVARAVAAPMSSILERVTFEIAPLRPGQLALADGTRILVSPTAADWGWFVDATPGDDGEFGDACTAHTRAHIGRWAAADGIDLLTALMHEIGHVLGESHRDGERDPEHLMMAVLPAGTRRDARFHSGAPYPLRPPLRAQHRPVPCGERWWE